MTLACISNASGLKQVALTARSGQGTAPKGVPGGAAFRSLLGATIQTDAGKAGTEAATAAKGHGFLALAASVLRPETAAAASNAALHPPALSPSTFSSLTSIPH